MKIIKGDLWDWHKLGWKIVITTNIGWGEGTWAKRRTIHANNMGAGIALQACLRWPWLSEWLGSHYRARHLIGAPQRPVELAELRLIFLPVKPLKEHDPAYSWNQKASAELVRLQLGMLAQHQGRIALGFPGCGNGGLEPAEVLPGLLKLEIARAHMGHGETIVVDRQAE